jgi:hypothetical protein
MLREIQCSSFAALTLVIHETVFGCWESSTTHGEATIIARENTWSCLTTLDSRQPKTVSGMNCLAKHCFFVFSMACQHSSYALIAKPIKIR